MSVKGGRNRIQNLGNLDKIQVVGTLDTVEGKVPGRQCRTMQLTNRRVCQILSCISASGDFHQIT